jgi:4-diphosphocytidyl-2-C-methyl-D-erythritol kinase
MSEPWVSALAPAKVNPTLWVLDRRDDGFHEVETTLMAVDLCDRLRVRRSASPGIRLSVSGPQATADIPVDERNLALRGARAALEALTGSQGREIGLELELEKHIPSGAGLGGGRSDAAAAALASARALGSSPQWAELGAWVAPLGADCAFFALAASTGFARCRGRGERVEPLASPSPPWQVLLLAPRLSLPTARVYGAVRRVLSLPRSVSSLPGVETASGAGELRRLLANDLEAVALSVLPELRAWRALFDRSGFDHLRLSGSGSAWFGLFDDPARAHAARAELVDRLGVARLGLGGAWVVQSAGHGARLIE